MTDKPSCPNCPTFKAGIDHGESGMGYCEIDHRIISWQQWCILKEKGCLSHPQAREYLMEPVLKELERLKTEARTEHDGAQSYGLRLDRRGKVDAMEVAITLIKNGVEK